MTYPPLKKNFDSAVLRVLKHRDWQLVSPVLEKADWRTFISKISDYLSESENSRRQYDTRVDRAVTGAYCGVLYNAAIADGTNKQQRAFTEIHHWIYSIIRKRISNENDAQDVAQEILEAIYKKLHTVTAPRGFLAWVGAFTRNQLKRYYTRANAQQQRETSIIFENDEEDRSEEAQALAYDEAGFNEVELSEAESELLALIDDCVSKKAWKQKSIFIEFVFHERSALEVAEKLGENVGNIYVLYHRARKTLLTKCPQLIARLLAYLTAPDRLRLLGEEK